MEYVYDNGGRAEAGYKGDTGDCGVRAVAIATGETYQNVYNGVNAVIKARRQTKRIKANSARSGVHRDILDEYLAARGWVWVPTMEIGTGCTVRLCAGGGLPEDRTVIARLSKHFVCVDHGVIRDTHDPRRGDSRCVYGYWERL